MKFLRMPSKDRQNSSEVNPPSKLKKNNDRSARRIMSEDVHEDLRAFGERVPTTSDDSSRGEHETLTAEILSHLGCDGTSSTLLPGEGDNMDNKCYTSYAELAKQSKNAAAVALQSQAALAGYEPELAGLHGIWDVPEARPWVTRMTPTRERPSFFEPANKNPDALDDATLKSPDIASTPKSWGHPPPTYQGISRSSSYASPLIHRGPPPKLKNLPSLRATYDGLTPPARSSAIPPASLGLAAVSERSESSSSSSLGELSEDESRRNSLETVATSISCTSTHSPSYIPDDIGYHANERKSVMNAIIDKELVIAQQANLLTKQTLTIEAMEKERRTSDAEIVRTKRKANASEIKVKRLAFKLHQLQAKVDRLSASHRPVDDDQAHRRL